MKDEHNVDARNMKPEEHMAMGHEMPSSTKRSGAHEAVEHDMKAGHEMKGMSEREHHAMMSADYRRRFWVSLILTVPILLLSPLIQGFLGLEGRINFPGDSYVLFALSLVVYFYGGWPFLRGIFNELKSKSPAMMTLIDTEPGRSGGSGANNRCPHRWNNNTACLGRSAGAELCLWPGTDGYGYGHCLPTRVRPCHSAGCRCVYYSVCKKWSIDKEPGWVRAGPERSGRTL
jgi:hypothetical protein